MSWVNGLQFHRSRLRPPAPVEAIKDVQRQLGWQLPSDFVEFLAVHDGGDVCNKRYALFSVGPNRYPGNTLVEANANLPGDDLGFGPSEDFRFRKADLPVAACPVYTCFHETWDLRLLAPSFRDLLTALASASQQAERQ